MGASLSQQAAAALVNTRQAFIVNAAPVPNAGNNNQGDVVIIPVDGSQQAEIAFNWYMKHVHRPENVIRLVHCYEKPIPPAQFYPAPRTVNPESWEEVLRKSKEKTEGLIVKYEQKLKELKLNGGVEASTGKPGEIVVKAADKHSASMIVMGSRGLGLIRRTVLGSVSEYVIHHTKIPVTLVPKDEKHNPLW